MTTPVKHGAISLVIHLVALFFMLVVCKWGIYSLVVGNIVFSLTMCILNALALRKAAGYHQEVKKTFLIPVGAAVFMGIAIVVAWNGFVIFLPKAVSTVLTVGIAACVYGVALLKMGGLSAQEIAALPKGTSLLKLLQKFHLVRKES